MLQCPGKKENNADTNLDELIEEITVDADGDDEQLWALRQVIEDEVELPADGFIIDEPARVTKIDYDGNTRRGLTATFRRNDGSKHVVAAADITFPRDSVARRYVAAYRRWLGLLPYPTSDGSSVRKTTENFVRRTKSQECSRVGSAVRETASGVVFCWEQNELLRFVHLDRGN
jgi:hypothetical protein